MDGSVVAGDEGSDQAGGFVDEIAFALDVIFTDGFRPEISAVLDIQQFGGDPGFFDVDRRFRSRAAPSLASLTSSNSEFDALSAAYSSSTSLGSSL